FVPIAFVSLWIVLAAEPGNGWFHRHVLAWSGDIHIRGLVNDLKEYVSVFAFGIGLVFGYSFDTTGPRVRGRGVVADRRVDTAPPRSSRALPRRRRFGRAERCRRARAGRARSTCPCRSRSRAGTPRCRGRGRAPRETP